MWVKVANEKSQVLYIKRLAIFKSDSRGIQTHNLLIRSQMLYSVELGSLFKCGCKGKDNFLFLQIFWLFFSFILDFSRSLWLVWMFCRRISLPST